MKQQLVLVIILCSSEPNNAGKSNFLNALRAFYGDINWSDIDIPKNGCKDDNSWIELTFNLTDEEWLNLAEKYKNGAIEKTLVVRRFFKSEDKIKSN